MSKSTDMSMSEYLFNCVIKLSALFHRTFRFSIRYWYVSLVVFTCLAFVFQQVFIPWYIKKNYSETGYPLANAPRHVHWLAWIAPVNSPDLDILNRACYDNMPELAESLLKRGADPN